LDKIFFLSKKRFAARHALVRIKAWAQEENRTTSWLKTWELRRKRYRYILEALRDPFRGEHEVADALPDSRANGLNDDELNAYIMKHEIITGECGICQDDFIGGLVKIPCGHTFCREDFAAWMTYHRDCPICRVQL
jgi:hypothetical protein